MISTAIKARDNSAEATRRNPVYQLLSTSEDCKPGLEFFYNDEVISHLHGYVFLVGLFGAKDEVSRDINHMMTR